MMSTKLQLVAAGVLAVGLLGSGTTGPVQPAASAQVAAAAAQETPATPGDAKKNDVFGDPLPDGVLGRLGTVRWRHGNLVTFVSYLPDGKQILTATQDGVFSVWDVGSGRVVRRFGSGQPAANPNQAAVAGSVGLAGLAGIALSSDGKLLAAVGSDGAIRLLEVAAGTPVRQIGTPPANTRVFGNQFSIAFAPDGKRLVARGLDQVARLWDVETGKEIRQLGKPGPNQRVIGGAGALLYSPDGKLIAALGFEQDNMQFQSVVRLFDAETGNEVRTIKGTPNAYSAVVAFAAGGKGLAWAGVDGVIRMYDVATGKELRQIGEAQQRLFSSNLVFAADGKLMAARSVSGIRLFDHESGKELRVLGQSANPAAAALSRANLAGPQSIAFSPDGKLLAEAAPGNLVRFWEVDTGKEIVPVKGHQGGVGFLAVSGDGTIVTTRGSDDSVRRWDLQSGKELHQFKLPGGPGALSADGKVIAVGMPNNTIQLFDTATGKEIRSVAVPAAANPFAGRAAAGGAGLALSPDSKVLAVRGGDGALRLFETATGKELHSITEVQLAAANPNAAFFVAGFNPGRSSSLIFSPDGSTIAAIGSPARFDPQRGTVVPGAGTVRLWNVGHGKQVRQFSVKDRTIAQAAFTPDNALLVSANSDNSISVWEIVSGRECLHFPVKLAQPNQATDQAQLIRRVGMVQSNSGITSLAVSRDGRTLAAGCGDQRIRLFNLRTGEAQGEFVGHQGSVLDVCFAPDGVTLISGSADTTALVWDGARFIKPEAPAALELSAEQLEGLWNDLTGDPAKAYQAILALGRAPKQAVALLRDRVKPQPGVPGERIDQLIGELDSDKFEARQKASDELLKLGELAQPALTKVLKSQPALETRQRVERILERINTDSEPPAELLRALRSVRVLRQAGTPEAGQVLKTIARGAAGAKLTRLAEEAVNSLAAK